MREQVSDSIRHRCRLALTSDAQNLKPHSPFPDKQISLPSRNEMVCHILRKYPRHADRKRVLSIRELVPANLVEMSEQHIPDIHPHAAIRIQRGATQKIGAMRSHI